MDIDNQCTECDERQDPAKWSSNHPRMQPEVLPITQVTIGSYNESENRFQEAQGQNINSIYYANYYGGEGGGGISEQMYQPLKFCSKFESFVYKCFRGVCAPFHS